MPFLLPGYLSSPSYLHGISLIAFSSSVSSKDFSGHQYKIVPPSWFTPSCFSRVPHYIYLAWYYSVVSLFIYGLPPTTNQSGRTLSPLCSAASQSALKTANHVIYEHLGTQLLQRQHFHWIFWFSPSASALTAQILSLKDEQEFPRLAMPHESRTFQKMFLCVCGFFLEDKCFLLWVNLDY